MSRAIRLIGDVCLYQPSKRQQLQRARPLLANSSFGEFSFGQFSFGQFCPDTISLFDVGKVRGGGGGWVGLGGGGPGGSGPGGGGPGLRRSGVGAVLVEAVRVGVKIRPVFFSLPPLF